MHNTYYLLSLLFALTDREKKDYDLFILELFEEHHIQLFLNHIFINVKRLSNYRYMLLIILSFCGVPYAIWNNRKQDIQKTNPVEIRT